MVRKILLSAALILAFTVGVFADQAAWVTQKQAEAATVLLKEQKQIRHYCAPCDDKDDRVVDVSEVSFEKVPNENYWNVIVNGKSIDLAYVYFKTKDGRWKNVAMHLSIKVEKVPKHLD